MINALRFLAVPVAAAVATLALCVWINAIEPGVPAIKSVEGQAVATPDLSQIDPDAWERMTLPVRLCVYVNCKQPYELVRLPLQLEETPTQPWVLFAPNVESAAVLFVNGVRVRATGAFTPTVDTTANRPVRMQLPSGLLRAGANEIHLVIAERFWGVGKLGQLYLGPAASIDGAYRVHRLVRVDGILWGTAMVIALSLVSLMAWGRNRSESILLWFALLGCAYAGRSLMGIATTQIGPLHWDIGLNYCITFALIATSFSFATHYADRRWPRTERLILWLVIPASLYVVWLATQSPRLAVINGNQVVRYGGIAILLAVLSLLLRKTLTERSPRDALVLAGLVTAATTIIWDIVQSWPPGMLNVPMAQVGMLPLVLVFAIELANRYSDSRRALVQSNTDLADALSAREAELRESYEKLAEARQVAAVAGERQRILRDVHDGFGGRLAGLSLKLKTGRQAPEQTHAAIDESLRDLRLMLNALDTVPDDLALALGSLRSQLQPWVEGHGLEFRWQNALAQPVAFDGDATLDIYRTIQEACSNAIRHSGASVIEIDAKTLPGLHRITIADNGSWQASRTEGRGLGHMRERAARISATLDIDRGEQGTTVTLDLPLQSAG